MLQAVLLHLLLGDLELTYHNLEDLKKFVENKNHRVIGAKPSTTMVLLLLRSHDIVQLGYNLLQYRVITLKLPVNLS